MNLNLRQIEVFRAVMLTGSISGAARLLSVSQPAVSRLLAYTEDRLGLKLFERARGRLRPTPEARRLFTEVDEVYKGVQRVNELAQDLLRKSTGTLRIVASPSVGQALVPQAIALFRERHPEVRIEFQTLTLAELVRHIANGQSDIGISVLPVDHPNVVVTPMGEGRLVCICHRQHRLARRASIRPDDLAPYPLISYGPETPYGMLVGRFLARAAREIRIGVQVRFSPVACALVQAGAGIAIADEFVATAPSWPDIVARPVVPKTTMRVNLLTSRHEPISQVARGFVALLRGLVPGVPPAPSNDKGP